MTRQQAYEYCKEYVERVVKLVQPEPLPDDKAYALYTLVDELFNKLNDEGVT